MLKSKFTRCHTQFFAVSILFSIVFTSCKKNLQLENQKADEEILTESTKKCLKNPIVYVAGGEYAGAYNVAKYWKNGLAIRLGDTTVNSFANSIFVNKKNVFVAGYTDFPKNYVALYWKNGKAVLLADGITTKGVAKSIYVCDKDVYVCGESGKINSLTNPDATIWKNGVATDLSEGNGVIKRRANSVYVNKGSVYVCGEEFYKTSTAHFWKNNILTTIYNPISSIAQTTSIFVSDTSTYIAGSQLFNTKGYPPTYSNSYAVYWKNGIQIKLSDGVNSAYATGIYVTAQQDVYVAGYDGKVALYWKNGQAIPLTNGVNPAMATAIFIFNNDVYVAGKEFNGQKYVAKYWKNGQAVTLTNGNSDAYANSIYVSCN